MPRYIIFYVLFFFIYLLAKSAMSNAQLKTNVSRPFDRDNANNIINETQNANDTKALLDLYENENPRNINESCYHNNLNKYALNIEKENFNLAINDSDKVLVEINGEHIISYTQKKFMSKNQIHIEEANIYFKSINKMLKTSADQMMSLRLHKVKPRYVYLYLTDNEILMELDGRLDILQLFADCNQFVTNEYIESIVFNLNKVIFRAKHAANNIQLIEMMRNSPSSNEPFCIMHYYNEFLIHYPFIGKKYILKYHDELLKKQENHNLTSKSMLDMKDNDCLYKIKTLSEFIHKFRSLCREISLCHLIKPDISKLTNAQMISKEKKLLALHENLIKFTNTLSSLAPRNDVCNNWDKYENTESLVFELTMIILRIQRERAHLEDSEYHKSRAVKNLMRKIHNLSLTSLNLILTDIDNCIFQNNGYVLSVNMKTREELFPDKYESARSYVGNVFKSSNIADFIKYRINKNCYRERIFNERWVTYDEADITNNVKDKNVEEIWFIEEVENEKSVKNGEYINDFENNNDVEGAYNVEDKIEKITDAENVLDFDYAVKTESAADVVNILMNGNIEDVENDYDLENKENAVDDKDAPLKQE